MTLCPFARQFTLLALGECPCTYCKSLWIRAYPKLLNVKMTKCVYIQCVCADLSLLQPVSNQRQGFPKQLQMGGGINRVYLWNPGRGERHAPSPPAGGAQPRPQLRPQSHTLQRTCTHTHRQDTHTRQCGV